MLEETSVQGPYMKKSTLSGRYAVVCELLREARQRTGLKQSELAARLDEPQSYISKVENGDRRVDLVQLQLFCEAIGIDLKDFVAEYLRKSRKSRRS
jgi:transcriptional regulator with XRE-family HTH domain